MIHLCDTHALLWWVRDPERPDQHGLLAGALAWDRKDPFDRVIAAQAILEGAVLISADPAFDSVQDLRRRW
ncbi:MAG: hypothetical protein LBD51_09860 [Bifidobacteriaceae bacterium]|nr:hypothetical protein [Bifidobacteriaceae bacterium]